jgi:hypothetical protein
MKIKVERVDRPDSRDVDGVERYWGGVGASAGEVDAMWAGEVWRWVEGAGGRVKDTRGGVFHRRGQISTSFVEN